MPSMDKTIDEGDYKESQDDVQAVSRITEVETVGGQRFEEKWWKSRVRG